MSKSARKLSRDAGEITRSYENAIKWAIVSADTPYIPGTLARAYKHLRKEHYDSINQEVNRIFRQQTGVTRSLNQSSSDLRLRRQWLRIRDVVLARRLELRGTVSEIEYRWAIHQVKLSDNLFEIDIEDRSQEAPVIQPAVTHLIFNRGTVPQGFSLEMKSHPNFDRWTVRWDSSARLAQNLTWQFRTALMYPKNFDEQWRAKNRRDRVRRQKATLEALRRLHTPNKNFGGRTPWEVMDMPPGNYEIKGQGFITVWKDYVYFYPLFKDEDANEAIRWFLRRKVALPYALHINSRQQSGLLKQALVGSVLVLQGGLKLRSHGAPNQAMKNKLEAMRTEVRNTSLKELANHDLKNAGQSDLMTVTRQAVQTASEVEAQATVDRLAKVQAVKLKVLEPIR